MYFYSRVEIFTALFKYKPIASLNLPYQTNDPKRDFKKGSLLYVKDVTDKDITLLEEWKKCMSVPPMCTAFDFLKKHSKRKKISTTINDLDIALNGGLSNPTICEFCGSTGSGKTQICFNICVNFLLRPENKSRGVFFISTNDNFAVHRIKEIIKSSHEYRNQSEDERDVLMNDVLERVHVIELDNVTELVATVKYLEKFLVLSKISLLIIDSIFIPFKLVEYDNRCRILYRIFADLQKLAEVNEFAIILTNNYTTRVTDSNNSNPAMYLGENYYHRINLRILLSKSAHHLYSATILKSNSCKQINVPFAFK